MSDRPSSSIGFAPERVAKILAKEGTHLRKQPEWQRHLA